MPKVVMPDKEPKLKKPSRIGRFFKRLGLAVVGLLLLCILFVVGSVWVDARVGKTATDFTNTTFASADGTEIHAYVTDSAEGKELPAIVMFHEWWGINDDIVTLADALAEEGYVVIAPDAYRGQTTRWIPSALWLATQTDEDQIAADMDAAFDYLTSLPNVDETRIGSVGFCFGGRQSFNLAARQKQSIDAAVSLYGTAYTKKRDLEVFSPDIPMLAIFGADDEQIPVADVQTMDELMDEVGLDHEVRIWEGVGHAFVNGENYDEPGQAGEAWDLLVEFFAEELGDSAETIIRSIPLAKSPFANTAQASALPEFMCLQSH